MVFYLIHPPPPPPASQRLTAFPFFENLSLLSPIFHRFRGWGGGGGIPYIRLSAVLVSTAHNITCQSLAESYKFSSARTFKQFAFVNYPTNRNKYCKTKYKTPPPLPRIIAKGIPSTTPLHLLFYLTVFTSRMKLY